MLQYRLGLKHAISWTLAGRTLMFDVIKHEWSEKILNEIGISKKQLAVPLSPGSAAGKIDKDVANRLGLSESTVIGTGGHDQTCSALGAGTIKDLIYTKMSMI